MRTQRRFAAMTVALVAIAHPASAPPREQLIRGLVVDFRGAPVAGARVEVSDQVADGNLLGTTTTDAGGSFEIRTRPSDHSYVRVGHVDFPPAVAQFSNSPLRIILRRAFRIQGVALKRHGTPFAAAQVEVLTLGLGGRKPLSSRATTSDDGSFSIDDIPPDFMDVRLFDRTGRMLIDGMHVQPSAVPESGLVIVEFTRRPVHVRGRVRWSGAPLPDVLVYPSRGGVNEGRPTLRPPDEPGLPYLERAITLTGPDGRFEIYLPPGSVSLAVERRDRTRDFGRQTIDVPDDEECSLEVDLAPMLSGVVVDEATGKAIPGAGLQVRPESVRTRGPSGWWQLAGPDGSFGFNLEPGDYVLWPRASQYEPAEIRVAIGSRPHPDLRIELTRALTIAGRVLLPGGASWGYAGHFLITARSADGRHTGAR